MTTTHEGFFHLEVRKLKRPEEEHDEVEEAVLELHGDTSLQRIWEELEDLGYEAPDTIELNGKTLHRYSTQHVFHPFKEVEVVSDQAAVDETHVHVEEPLYACSNRHQEVKFEIISGENDSHAERQMNSLAIDDNLTMIFHRTVRMPDDNRLHSLPPSVGSFPLYNVADYGQRLPDDIVEKGGVFLPMWQREALWVEFQTSGGFEAGTHRKTYAIRVYIGRINAVTGTNMMEERTETSWVQDYVVVPGQRWIDGVCVAPGVVRQFVAMPLGSGYTVEGQKTSGEKHGGLQIEIIPAYQKNLSKWLAATEEEALRNARLYLDEAKTPAELGLKIGAKIRSYPPEATYRRLVVLSDLVAPRKSRILAEATYFAPLGTYGHGGLRGPSGPRGPAPQNSRTSSRCSGKNGPNPVPSSMTVGSLSRMGGQTAEPAVAPLPLRVKGMGLAAGGKLIQDIISDANPPSAWNVDAARVIHVHIFDPVSCESVTHIVPPSIPMSAYQAVAANMPFFLVEEQVNDRVEGGEFDEVKSISQMDEKKGIVEEPSFDPTQPTVCKQCEKRLCDCIVRPCDHQFCNVCIQVLGNDTDEAITNDVHCPQCNEKITRVAGFSAPMNLPGEESVRTKMPVRILTVNDGRVKFQSIRHTRI